jgi:hypothetical protein
VVREPPQGEAHILPDPLALVIAQSLESRNSPSRPQLAEGLGDVAEDQPLLGAQQSDELVLGLRAADVAQRTDDVTLVVVRLVAVELRQELWKQARIGRPRGVDDLPATVCLVAFI